MKRISLFLLISFVYSFTFVACADDDKTNELEDETSSIKVSPVGGLSAVATSEENEISLSWRTPKDANILKVEVTDKEKETVTKASASPVLVDVVPGELCYYTLYVPRYATYTITATTIDNSGKRSNGTSVEGKPLFAEDVHTPSAVLLTRADTLITSMIEKCLGGPRNVWRSYPKPDGYWDGDAIVWGQGAGFSAFSAMREASSKDSRYKSKYAVRDNQMVKSIDVFRVVDGPNNIDGYSVYPAKGNERFFDDNVWIGIDMIDLYVLTGNTLFLSRAETVWKYLETGMDIDGGMFWKELPDKSTSKHACSTAPTAVMAAKMYLATDKQEYLEKAKKSYAFCINILQDKSDYLICDLQTAEGAIDRAKYTYNSGQVVQAGTLLYNITKEYHYLSEAQKIAQAMYNKWFYKFYSNALNKEITMIGGHTWFNAVALRGFMELYKVDGNRTYVNAYNETLSHAWLSNCRDKELQLLKYESFEGGVNQTSWDILQLGATVEMVARLATLQTEGLLD